MARPAHLGDWLALLGLAVLWGTAFLFIELALRSFTPATMVAVRVFIGAVVLIAVLGFRGFSLPRNSRDILALITMATLGTVLPFYLTAWAQQHIDSALTGILMAIVPLFVIGLSHFFLPGERITAPRALGFMSGFAGAICIIGPETLNIELGNMQMWGMFAVLGAALSYSVNAIYVRRRGTSHPTALAARVMLVAALLALPGAVFDFPKLAMPLDGLAVLSVGVLGLLCTGLASVLYFRIVQGPGPAFMSQVSYLIPVVAVLVGVVFLDETVSTRALVGLGLIVSGIALSELGATLHRTFTKITRTVLPAVPATDKL